MRLLGTWGTAASAIWISKYVTSLDCIIIYRIINYKHREIENRKCRIQKYCFFTSKVSFSLFNQCVQRGQTTSKTLVIGYTVVCVSLSLKGAGHIHEVCPLEGTVPVWGRKWHQLWREGSTVTLHQINQWCVRCRKITYRHVKLVFTSFLLTSSTVDPKGAADTHLDLIKSVKIQHLQYFTLLFLSRMDYPAPVKLLELLHSPWSLTPNL